jgi:hypothetical protein
MRYFRNPENNEVYGYDETQQSYIDKAIANGWIEITGEWPLPPVMPEITIVTMRQCRLALLQEGQLDDVEGLMKTREQFIWWDYSIMVEKYNPIVQDIATALGWTPEYLTSIFEMASAL